MIPTIMMMMKSWIQTCSMTEKAVQYHHGIFEENDYDPTIQDVHRKNVRLNDKREYCLEIRDTAGEPELRGCK